MKLETIRVIRKKDNELYVINKTEFDKTVFQLESDTLEPVNRKGNKRGRKAANTSAPTAVIDPSVDVSKLTNNNNNNNNNSTTEPPEPPDNTDSNVNDGSKTDFKR